MGDFKNKAEELGGKAKEGLGKATGNDRMETEGRTESTAAKSKGAVQDAADKVSDTARGAVDGVKNAFGKN